MKLTRREFLPILAGGLAISKLNAATKDKPDNLVPPIPSMPVSPEKPYTTILPKALRKGSVVAITAPASQTSTWEVAAFCKSLQKLGLKTKIGDTIKVRQKEYKYLSASDQERADEFMQFILDPSVDAIVSGRGGYGVMRILPLLDYDVIKANPKIIVGFSDITALINAIHQKTGLITYHGPIAVSSFNQFTEESFVRTLFEAPKSKVKPISYSKIETLSKGTANGRLVGGNLTMLVSTLGTPFEVETKDSIFFIEEVSEEPYKIDRMLTQLALAGKFDNLKGMIFGYYKTLDQKRNFFPGASFTARQVIETRFKSLEIPCILGFPIGHINDKLTMPIGVMAELDATKKTFRLTQPSVRSEKELTDLD